MKVVVAFVLSSNMSIHLLWVRMNGQRTNREVLHWIKKWDPIVFPDASGFRGGKAIAAERAKIDKKVAKSPSF